MFLNGNNMCIFEGRITKEPTYNTHQNNGNSFESAMFTIAVARKLTSAQKSNNAQDTDFVPLRVSGNQVNFLKTYGQVGRAVKVVGCYSTYTKTDQVTGAKSYGYNFEVVDISFAVSDSKKLQDQQNQGNQGNQGQSNQDNYQSAPSNYNDPNRGNQNNRGQANGAPQGNNNFQMFDNQNNNGSNQGNQGNQGNVPFTPQEGAF